MNDQAEADGRRRSLNVLFRLGADFGATREFRLLIVYRERPNKGLGGPWRRQQLDVRAKTEHEARRIAREIFAEIGHVKSIDCISCGGAA